MLKTEFNPFVRGAYHALGGIVCSGAVLVASSTQAQNLFASDYASGKIYEFTPSGVQSTFASGLTNPTAVAFNSAGDLFVAANDPGTIYEFTPAGQKSTFASGLSDPQGLTFDSSGDLFEADWITGTIYKFTPGGVKSTFVSGLVAPTGLAFDSSGDLFVAEQNGLHTGGNQILMITPGGVQRILAGAAPYGLAFNRAGDLFEADWGSGAIYEFPPGGMRSTFASGLRYPWGLAFNSADDLFVSDLAAEQIYEFTSDGTQSTFASGSEFDGLAFQPVPEPSALELLAIGITAVLVRRRKQ